MLAVGAFAQGKGEADPAQSKAAPSTPATATEKAAAKKQRRIEGAAAAKEMKTGEQPSPSMGTRKSATKAERAAARKHRRAAAADALKKGEIPAGETPPGGK